jgi:sulfur carrier protein
MEVIINNNKQFFDDNQKILSDLIFNDFGDNVRGIAVAVNDTIIPKNLWEKTIIKHMDNIVIFKITQGG